MGDNVDMKNSENMSSDNALLTLGSSEVNSIHIDPVLETSCCNSETEVVVNSAPQAEMKASNSDVCVSSISKDLPSTDSVEQPDSTVSVLEVHHEDDVDDSPDSTDCIVEASYSVNDCPDSANSILETSCKDSVGVDDSTLPYDSIMDVCSTAAQQIKKTITEVLKSRESGSEKLLEPDDFCFSLEANLKEKIADFEKTVEKTNSPTMESDNSSCVNNISSEQSSDNSNSEISQMEFDAKKTNEISEVSSNENLTDLSGTCTDSSISDSVPVQKLSDDVAQSKTVSNNEIPTVPEVSADSEKSKKNQKSSAVKKKGEKSVDQILKSLSYCSSSEEKLSTLCRKHIEVLEDLRSNESRLKQCERQAVVTLREKEQLQADHNRTILAKSRLESLCRELQRQNKAVKEESLLRIREEEEKRKDVASKFQMTLNDISNLMQDNSKKNLQLREENAELAKKLKSLVEHYEMWEKHMGKVLQQKDLEVQLAKAKLAKTNLQLKQETEKYLREKKDLLENMSELQKKCTELASNEVQLRTELSVYTSKYEEFQTVLNKSNQVFASFKTDMDTTSKKIKKLEKETNLWKTKWENSNGALLEMIADKQKRDKELINAQQRVLMLEKLCRALQAERNDLQNQVREFSNTDGTMSSSEEIATGDH